MGSLGLGARRQKFLLAVRDQAMSVSFESEVGSLELGVRNRDLAVKSQESGVRS